MQTVLPFTELTMPSVSTYTSAAHLPTEVEGILASQPRESNILYPHALQAARQAPLPGQFWLVCYTDNGTRQIIDFVLSCTEGSPRTLPIFIFSAHPVERLSTEFLDERLSLLVDQLLIQVPVERIFSVFSVDVVAETFATKWTQLTGITAYSKPYYHATLTYCTKRTFRPRTFTMFPDWSYELRPAVQSDIQAVAELCYGFAEGSEPFTLAKSEALQEATLLVNRGQVWVHTITKASQAKEIASIVAVTRESSTVSAITKVYTNPKWRSRKCAERLVRKVTQSLLRTKESVVLYVAHNNPAARKVYDRVGFVGISTDHAGTGVPGVSSWKEIGFDRESVDLGHW